jgi:hypothetical protein
LIGRLGYGCATTPSDPIALASATPAKRIRAKYVERFPITFASVPAI